MANENQNARTTDPQLYLRTPLIESFPMSRLAGCRVHLKLENLQPSSSFKIRGIGHHIKHEWRNGCERIIASSGGNAGLAAAYACKQLNLPITLFVPETTPEDMKERIRGEGAEVIVHGAAWDHANARAQEEAKQPGCAIVHPFDNPLVWEGHSSMMVEVAEDLKEKPDLVVVSVGGGGLMVGVIQGMERVGWGDVPVLALETVGADCFNQAVKAAKLVTLPAITSIAKHLGALTVCSRALEYHKSRPLLSEVVTDAESVDAIVRFAAKCLGALTVCQKALDWYRQRAILSEVITDQQCIAATAQFLDDHRMLVEPACGAALSAVYSGVISRLQRDGTLPATLRHVVIVVCGGHAVTLGALQAWKDKYCPS